MKYHLSTVPVIIMLICSIHSTGYAQTDPSLIDYPHNHLDWYTIESQNFYIHFQEGNYTTAQLSSKIAEEIYEPVTGLYNHQPDKKVSIILRDREDYSNGAAYFFDDKIEIWIPSLNTPFRGSHDWFRNVITHEFTHIIQLQASMKRSKSIPAIYFQWLSYEDVRRPDILYGFPNGIITLPFASVAIPAWFAEGTAQYQRSGLSYDYWDSHRDMLLRTMLLDGKVLSFTEMGIFSSKNSIEREMAYNQGFSFTIFLVHRFGETILADISETAAENSNSDFSSIIKKTTGISGETLFDEWITEKREEYHYAVEPINQTESEFVETNGFLNFFPQYDPDGEWFAYLSNRNRDYSATSLILKKDSTEIEVETLDGLHQLDSDQNYRISHGLSSNSSLDFISNRFSFSPDGSRITYSKAEKNKRGEVYQDLYIYVLDTKEHNQITNSRRISDPSWHPENSNIAAVQQNDGYQNLVLYSPDNQEITPLTRNSLGRTVYNPVWSRDGNSIFFSSAKNSTRNIYKYSLADESVLPVFEDQFVDFRDPWPEPNGEFLYFSSDYNSIFNIYRVHLPTHEIQQMTDVYGGAFMPFATGDSLYFSEFTSDGYKISSMELQNVNRQASFSFDLPEEQLTFDSQPDTGNLDQLQYNIYDSLSGGTVFSDELPGELPSGINIETVSGSDDRTVNVYNQITTGLSVFPVVRFDNYTKLNGSNSRLLGNRRFGDLGENLWRDMKIGAYFSSRDVTERLSIFGGALIGFGSRTADGVGNFLSPSRLNNLDRDIFLIFEHRGLPFIEKSWSPTVSVELYNIKRNVSDGLIVDEFPCTSCLPIEKSIDIRYNIWEASIFLRSKLNRWSLVELGATYSPYSVATDGFFSEEFQEFIPGSTSEYFKGATYSASYVVDATIPDRHYDIAPTGLKSSFSYNFQPGKLLENVEVNDGVLSPVYAKSQNQSLELRSRFGFPVLNESTGMITTRGFTYLNNPDDSFYLDYIGGLVGMRSYPYFALGGQKSAFLRASYITPVFSGINKQIRSYTADKLFAHLFLEAGNAWGGPLNAGNNLKYGIGGELRFAFNSYYLFPLKFFISSTYGFNKFDITLPADFITESDSNRISYGREILFQIGLTFDFEFL